MNIATNLRRLRSERGLSQQELGDLVDVHQTHISQIEKGSKTPSLALAQRLAEYLGVTVDELLGDSHPEPIGA